MPDAPGKPLSPSQLSEVLARLDEVMAEAERLRREITKQMNDQRRQQQPKVTRPRRTTRKRSS